jgi:hypothetical protein
MAKKYDGVIEAVHYKNGQIVVVRAFERRGATFLRSGDDRPQGLN